MQAMPQRPREQVETPSPESVRRVQNAKVSQRERGTINAEGEFEEDSQGGGQTLLMAPQLAGSLVVSKHLMVPAEFCWGADPLRHPDDECKGQRPARR